jgi:putative ABC transport system ATP-binding protein
MKEVLGKRNKTLVMVTHDNELAALADRQIRIKDGKIIENI